MINFKSLLILAAAALCSLQAQAATCCQADSLQRDDCGVVRKINPQKKEIYLVFTAHFSTNDQGKFENFDGIWSVLDTLKSRGVHGSFFPTGVCFEQPKYERAIERILLEGHYLSAHSYGHLLLVDDNGKTRIGADSIARDLAKMQHQLERFGLAKSQFRWMIPPYETYNQETADALRQGGYSLLNPTAGIITDMDWAPLGAKGYRTGQQILDNLWAYEQQHTLQGVILLVHAMHYPNRPDQDRVYTHLGEIIDHLRAEGYQFKTLKDVIAHERCLCRP